MPSSSLWRPCTVPTGRLRPGSSQRRRRAPRPESHGLSVRGLADLAARISALDRAAALRMAQTDSLALDRVMPALSRLADHNLLWIVLALGLRASGDRWASRAAWRGLGSVPAARATANLPPQAPPPPPPPHFAA